MKQDIFMGFHHCLWWFYKDLTVSGSNSWDLFESTSGQKLTEDPQWSHVYMGLTPSTSGFSPNCGRLMLQLFRYHLVSPLDHVHQWMKVPFLKRPQQTMTSWLHKPSSQIFFIDFVRILTVWSFVTLCYGFAGPNLVRWSIPFQLTLLLTISFCIVCWLRVSNRILKDFFFALNQDESRRPEPKGGFDHSGCLAAASPPGGGVWVWGAVWGQGFSDLGSAEISQTGRRFKLTDEPWICSKLVNHRVSDSEVCCPSQQWEPPGKVFGFCSTCPTKKRFPFLPSFPIQVLSFRALGFSLWFTVFACGCTVFGFRFMAGPGSQVGLGCRWGKACCLLDKEQEMGPLFSWASRWSREKLPPSTTRETWFKLRLGIGDDDRQMSPLDWSRTTGWVPSGNLT